MSLRLMAFLSFDVVMHITLKCTAIMCAISCDSVYVFIDFFLHLLKNTTLVSFLTLTQSGTVL